MTSKLTNLTTVSATELEKNKLTNRESAYFKLIFSNQIYRRYTFNTIHHPSSRPRFSDSEYAKVLHSLGKFIDVTVRLTITEVEEKYHRKPFRSDTVKDPETNQMVKVEHLCLFDKEDPNITTSMPSDSIRLHGYYRGEYFIIIRLDWFHKFKTVGL